MAVHLAEGVAPGSVFRTVEEASAFFRSAPLSYAATPRDGELDGIELTTEQWSIAPASVDEVRSSFFDDPNRFAPGTIAVDSAFLMTNLETTWRPQPKLRAPVDARAALPSPAGATARL